MAFDPLLQEFPPVSTELWEEQILKDLKGGDYARKLIWQTDEGLAVKPYYRSEDLAGLKHLDSWPGEFPFVRGTRSTGDWRIREEIEAGDPKVANVRARQAVEAGAEEVAFGNVEIGSADQLGILLAELGGIPVHLVNADEPLLRLLMQRGNLPISTDWDPFTNLEMAAELLAADSPALALFLIDGAKFEELGATAVQEIGFTLAASIDFLGAMQARKVEVNRAAKSVGFSFAIGSSYFFQIAKLRAFRMLWARAVESFGGDPENGGAHIHARSSRWNETIYDPYVNILRGATEAMSAAIGGADSISVGPFDEAYKSPSEASRRLARNTQIILKQEAMLSRVSDPGAGSYYLEALTDLLAREGWKTMQSIEAQGGYGKSLAEGLISRGLRESLAVKEKDIAWRRRVFTGTTLHPNLSEKALDRIDPSIRSQIHRGAEVYEEIRLRTERYAAQNAKLPRILLAEIGDARMSSARANFAADLFGCAGLETLAERFGNVEEIVGSSADLIVLCSSDPEYSEIIVELIAQLKTRARQTPVIVAGDPDFLPQLKSAGVADFVHLRINAIEFLKKWQECLGIRDSE